MIINKSAKLLALLSNILWNSRNSTIPPWWPACLVTNTIFKFKELNLIRLSCFGKTSANCRRKLIVVMVYIVYARPEECYLTTHSGQDMNWMLFVLARCAQNVNELDTKKQLVDLRYKSAVITNGQHNPDSVFKYNTSVVSVISDSRMIVFLVCSAALTFAVGQVESNSYSSYSAPQRPCSGGSFCGGHPNALPFEPRYPSVRVGVSPGYPGESEGGNYESSEAPESNYGGPSKEVGPLCPPPPPPANDENQLPVSVCVQLPPKTPLKLSKSILQQIIFSLTESNQDVDPVVDPAVSEPGSLPVYTPVQVPLYSPKPAYAPPPPQTPPAPQQPIYSPQPSYPPQPPQVYAESPVYAPQPASPVNPVEHVVYEQEPIPTTPSSIPALQTPRYPTYEGSGSTGASGQLPPYVQQQGRPGGTCQSCGSSLKPRYNQ